MKVCRLRGLAVLLFLMAVPAYGAGSLRVAPTRIDLPAGRRSVSITVTNTGREPTLLQIEAKRWSQQDGKDDYVASDDLIVSPPIFTLEGGSDQTVRIGLRRAGEEPAAPGRERAYRVFVQEVPAASPAGARELNVVLRIGVPLFITPTDASDAHLAWSLMCIGEAPLLSVHNDGGRAQRLDELSIVAEGYEGHERALYVLAGDTRLISLNGAPARTQRVELRALTAQHEAQESASCK